MQDTWEESRHRLVFVFVRRPGEIRGTHMTADGQIRMLHSVSSVSQSSSKSLAISWRMEHARTKELTQSDPWTSTAQTWFTVSYELGQ